MGIRLEDIAFISSFEARIEMLLCSGLLYIFSTKDGIWTCIDTHNKENTTDLHERPITAQDIAGNIGDVLSDALSRRGNTSVI